MQIESENHDDTRGRGTARWWVFPLFSNLLTILFTRLHTITQPPLYQPTTWHLLSRMNQLTKYRSYNLHRSLYGIAIRRRLLLPLLYMHLHLTHRRRAYSICFKGCHHFPQISYSAATTTTDLWQVHSYRQSVLLPTSLTNLLRRNSQCFSGKFGGNSSVESLKDGVY